MGEDKRKVGVIGGTGASGLDRGHESEVSTPYGDVLVEECQWGNTTVYLIKRHGTDHSIPPHLINFRGNMWAFKQLEVTAVIATAAAGSLKPAIEPGTFVICDQFLDFTKSRPYTYYDSAEVVHTDVTEPYCPYLRSILVPAAQACELPVLSAGCYVCTEGPRYETAAETKMFALVGGDVVGMTGVPEVVLARELGICYATIAVVTNYAPGLVSGKTSHLDVEQMMAKTRSQLLTLLASAVKCVEPPRTCRCSETD